MSDDDSQRKLRKTLLNSKTYCHEQIRLIHSRTTELLTELGKAAATTFLRTCTRHYLSEPDSLCIPSSDLQERERLYMQDFLLRVQNADTTALLEKPLEQRLGDGEISPKVEKLIRILLSQWTPTFTGLIFVEQRATVAMLAQLLSAHPAVLAKYNIATFVGTSSNANRKDNIIDLAQPRNQQDTLDDLRVGKKNLVIATSVLEEGIDVSTCHCVICFDAPKNLKSFIQRRGRARRQDSTYFIMLPDSSSTITKGPAEWEALEEEMKRAYLDDLRAVKLAEERESIDEPGERSFEVESTGLVSAKHLLESIADLNLNMQGAIDHGKLCARVYRSSHVRRPRLLTDIALDCCHFTCKQNFQMANK